MDDLLTIPDWNTLLDGTLDLRVHRRSAGRAASRRRHRSQSERRSLTLRELREDVVHDGRLYRHTDERPWGANNPRWQLYAYGQLDDMIPTSTINSPFYVVVMVGDDPSENDGNPLKDGTGDHESGARRHCAARRSVRAVRRPQGDRVHHRPDRYHRAGARIYRSTRSGRAEPSCAEGGRADARKDAANQTLTTSTGVIP